LNTSQDLFDNKIFDSSVDVVSDLLKQADEIYIKKLALNDWQWATNPNAHQGGAYIPHEDRDSGFFPPLVAKVRPGGGAEIRECFFEIWWPVNQSFTIKEARLANYRSKKEETHLTRLPAEPFERLNPASLLIVAKRRKPARYEAVTVDSNSPAYQHLVDLLELPAQFESGFFQPRKIEQTREERLFHFIGQAVSAFEGRSFRSFMAMHAVLPPPRDLADQARNRYLAEKGLLDLNPYRLKRPGDIVMEISRETELEIYREYEIRQRSLELINLILGDDPEEMSVQQALMNIVTEFPKIDRVLLSAAQTRKARAGASFEHHIERMLVDGGIPHAVQVVVESKRRPDFVLPDRRTYATPDRAHEAALVLSAKTTLRERWKQVASEIRNCDLYLATVDETIAANAIADMEQQGITLVVPESLKHSDTTTYRKAANVISFKEFFETELRKKRFHLWGLK